MFVSPMLLTLFAQTGTVSGSVRMEDTLDPVPGAYVVLDGTELGAVADASGGFVIYEVPVGGYLLRAGSVGCHPEVEPDVMVRPDRTTSVDFVLAYSVVDGGMIHVTPDYFNEDDSAPVSRTEFTGEQVRRSPGSAGDVSRVIAALPSVARVDDQYNGLPVRGGNPMENGIYIDGMRVPNINHFPRQGTSGGGLGMVNTDLIEEVRFSAGGFSPSFGNRLSSIMEIDIRQGSRDKFTGQLDMSMSGFGGVLEGPLRSGSWLICARRSYVDLIVDIAEVDALPTYSDFQAKVVMDMNQAHRLTFSALGASDYVDYTHDQAWEDGNDNYGVTDNWNVTAGLGWRYIWPGNGFTTTSLSFSGIHYGGDYYHTVSREVQALQNSTENSVTLRSISSFTLTGQLTLEAGIEGSQSFNSFDNFYAADTAWGGEPMPELHIQSNVQSHDAGLFVNVISELTSALTFTMGGRLDRNSLGGVTHLAPRGSMSWEPLPGTAVSLSAGSYFQNLPGELLSRSSDYEDLASPRAVHFVAGIRHLLSDETKVQLEGYLKEYSDFPYDPGQPGYFVLDGVSSEQDLYAYDELESGGEARSLGLELTVQKQLVNGFYGLLAGSVSISEYRNPGERWRPRIFDNGWTTTLEGGYRVGESWEFSCRWLAAGGRPYTPLDLQASQEQNRTILDGSRINGARYPSYSSLNIRADRRFNFSGSSLVCYISVWNLLDRRNPTATYWNRIENREDWIHQWGIMPIFGLEYEF